MWNICVIYTYNGTETEVPMYYTYTPASNTTIDLYSDSELCYVIYMNLFKHGNRVEVN